MGKQLFAPVWGDDAQVESQGESVSDTKVKAAPRKAPTKGTARTSTPSRTPAVKKPAAAAKPVAAAKSAASAEMSRLAADPVAYIESMPAVKRGASRRAFNSDLPGDLGAGLVEWCRVHEVSQRDVLRAFVTALLADEAGE